MYTYILETRFSSTLIPILSSPPISKNLETIFINEWNRENRMETLNVSRQHDLLSWISINQD